MNVVCLLGSPRLTGNSATAAKRFCDAAEKKGATIQTFALNKLHYRGCQACMTCKTKLDRCVIQEDLTQVLDSVQQTDILVMSSPVYYGDVSSQLKGFIDRTYSYLTPDYPTSAQPSRLIPGKELVFVLTQGHPDENRFADVYPRYAAFFKWYGFKDGHLIRACGVMDKGDIDKHAAVLKSAEDTANRLFG
jgi:multimeric flavodoxin WrbA